VSAGRSWRSQKIIDEGLDFWGFWVSVGCGIEEPPSALGWPKTKSIREISYCGKVTNLVSTADPCGKSQTAGAMFVTQPLALSEANCAEQTDCLR
jgi:hypothetical protein